MQIFTLCFQQFFILQQFFIWEFWSRELPRDEGRANWSTWGKRPTTSPKNLFYLHVRSEKSAVFDGCPLSPSSWLAVNHLPWTRRLLPPVQVQAAATWWLESATLMPWSVKPPHCDQPFMPLLWGGGGGAGWRRVPGFSVFGASSSDLCSLFYFQKMLPASKESQAESSWVVLQV